MKSTRRHLSLSLLSFAFFGGCALDDGDSDPEPVARAALALDEPVELFHATILVEGEILGAARKVETTKKSIGNVEYGDCTITTGLSECQQQLDWLASRGHRPVTVAIVGDDANGKRRRFDLHGAWASSVTFPAMDERSCLDGMELTLRLTFDTATESFDELDAETDGAPRAWSWRLEGAGIGERGAASLEAWEMRRTEPAMEAWEPSQLVAELWNEPEGWVDGDLAELRLAFFGLDGAPLHAISLKGTKKQRGKSGMATCTAIFMVEDWEDGPKLSW